MKKITICAIIMLLIAMVASTVMAATEQELLNKLKASYTICGSKERLSDADIVQIERYLSTHDVTAEQADSIMAKVDEVVAYLNTTGVNDLNKLSKDQKDKALSIVSDAAAVVDLKVSYDTTNKKLTVHDNIGSIVAVTDVSTILNSSNGSSTGSNGSNGSTGGVLNTTGGEELNALYIIVPVTAIIALAVAAKKLNK